MDLNEIERRADEIIERHLASVGTEVLGSHVFSSSKIYMQHCNTATLQHYKAQLAGVKEAALILAYEANAGYRSYVDSLVDKGKMKAIDSPRLFVFFRTIFVKMKTPMRLH